MVHRRGVKRRWVRPITASIVESVDRDDGEGGTRLETIARQVWEGSRGPGDFMDTFAAAIVYAQRSKEPMLLVTDLGERGRWMAVFSTPERLVAHSGDCDCLAATGADLLELVPPGVGLMVDPDDVHRFPVMSRLAPPELVARMWAQVVRKQR